MQFSATIKKFDSNADKTGWTYILVPVDIAQKINPGVRQGYRIKGKLDDYAFEGLGLLPMGGGDFILPLNATIRKSLGKSQGATIAVQMEVDTKPYELDADLTECLEDAPEASAAFYKMPRSHQNYYSKWVESAKTPATKAKRIAMAINALATGLDYGAMLRKAREDKKALGW